MKQNSVREAVSVATPAASAARAAACVLAALALALAAALAVLAPQPALAATSLTQVAEPLDGVVTDNESDNNYSLWPSSTVNSYLYENDDGGLTRVEFDDDAVLVETYTSQHELASTQTIDAELELFGGFYEGEDCNYLVFGQDNDDESDDVEVVRVVKYSKSWTRLDSCSVYGANTYSTFSFGSLRMTETDGQLYIYTCHEMYTSDSDGYNHQASMTFVIDESSMEVTDSFYEVGYITSGYASHSFNQFIQTDGESIYRVDHGDAYLRAVTITQIDVGDDVTSVGRSYTEALDIQGTIGANSTGVSVGGFELSANNCLIAGNSVDQSDADSYSASGQRNIFLTVTPKDDISTSSDTDLIWLTDYDEDSDITPRTPQLVKISNSKFLVMWEEYDSSTKETVTRMVTVDGSGKLTSDVESLYVRLSDCQPILTSEGYVSWYVTDGDAAILYTVDPDNLDDMTALTDGVSWSIDDEGVLTLYPTNGVSGVLRNVSSKSTTPWNDVRDEVTKVIIDDGVSLGVEAEYLFADCANLESVEGGEGLDTSATATMRSLFEGCSSLGTVDVSTWDTSNVKSMRYLFSECSSLEALDVSNWGVSSVTDMRYAFYKCSTLEELDVSDWDVSSVTEMNDMFYSCLSLATLDVSDWRTPVLEDVSYLFYGCSSLEALDLSQWDVSAVTELSRLFYNCSSLESLDVSTWDVSAVTEMRYLFYNCSSLESLDVSDWDVSAVTTMGYLFYRCSSLEELDVADWDVSAVTNMSYLFYGCSSLEQLDLSGWDIDDDASQRYFFTGCTGLRRISVSDSVVLDSYNRLPRPKWGTVSGQWKDDDGTVYSSTSDIPSETAATYTAVFDFDDAVVTLDSSSYYYTGSAIEPELSVTLGGVELVEGEDYTVSYSDNVGLGTASVTVTAAGDYLSGSQSASFTIVEYAHSYSSAVTTEATCTTDGVRTYTCSICGDSYTETIAATGHDYESAVTTAATCTTAGVRTYTCSICGDSYTETIAALGHSWGAGVVTEATCTQGGCTTYTCTVCGESYTDDETDALGHSYEGVVTTEATCTKDGVITYTCTRCGTSYTEPIEATGHDYEVATTSASCTTAGTTTYTCSVCGDSYTETGVALGHDYEASWTWADDCSSATLTLSCSRCGDVQSVAATVKSASAGSSIVYTATASYDGVEYSDERSVDAATGDADEDADADAEGIYAVTEGAKQTVEYGETLTIQIERTDGEALTADDFDYVMIDKEVIGGYYYVVWTVGDASYLSLTVQERTLDNLDLGSHTLVVYFVDGSAQTSFTLVDEGATDEDADADADDDASSDSGDSGGSSNDSSSGDSSSGNGNSSGSGSGDDEAEEEEGNYRFTDVQDPELYFFEAVYALADEDIITGVSDTLYGVGQNMTRAQFATIVWRIAGEPSTSYDAGYADVVDGKYYTEAINWAADEGIVTGYTNGKYGINDTLSFEDMCLIIARYANGGEEALREAIRDARAASVLSDFADGDAVASYATKGMAWCVEEGLVTGNTDGTIVPQEDVTRQRAAVVVARWQGLVD